MIILYSTKTKAKIEAKPQLLEKKSADFCNKTLKKSPSEGL